MTGGTRPCVRRTAPLLVLVPVAAAALAGCAPGPDRAVGPSPVVTVTATRAAPGASTAGSSPSDAPAARTSRPSPPPASTAPAPRTARATGTAPAPSPGAASPGTPRPGAARPGVVPGAGPPAAAREQPSRGGILLPPTGRGALSGRTIGVDPGHNGRYVARIATRQVPAGGGRTKACNTSGTQDVRGVPEHEYTWAVGSLLVDELRRRGAVVALTRPDDDGVGPCVDERARIGSAARADLVVSIHADGHLSPTARGFHVIVSDAMAGGPGVQGRSRAAARQVVAALSRGTGLGPSTYVGGGSAVVGRTDIAGLNLSEVPAVMLESGNMRQPEDARLLADPAERRRVAVALADAAQAATR